MARKPGKLPKRRSVAAKRLEEPQYRQRVLVDKRAAKRRRSPSLMDDLAEMAGVTVVRIR